MKPELKRKWVAALRSGKYKQGTGELFYRDEYCCLGVLCEVATGKPPSKEPIDYEAYFKRYGLESDMIEALCFDNDGGKSFKYIARKIERLP